MMPASLPATRRALLGAEPGELRVSVSPGAPPAVAICGDIDVYAAQDLRDELLWAIRRHGPQLTIDLLSS